MWVKNYKEGQRLKKSNFFKILKKKSFGGRADGSKSNSKDCAAVAVSYETDSCGAASNLSFTIELPESFTIEF